MKRKRLLLISLAVIMVAVVASMVGRAVWRTSRSRADRPNILLITFDTTRADHIGVYGWRHARTAALDKLAEQGIRFARAFAAAPVTLPSHTTIMTGLYPFYHGVRDNVSFELHEDARTLAERLRDEGYRTGAVVAAFVLDARFGLDQGFDDYRDKVPTRAETARLQIPERNAERVVDDAIDWLDSARSDKPFFLWCHFYDPHHPYLTPEAFPLFLGHPYDQEIAFADFHLQRLLDHLEQKPPNKRGTAIVLAGDHGEAHGECGEETHAYFVYNSTLHVPLILKMPDGSHAGSAIETPVSLADVMPTVLELSGARVPGDDEIHGRSLIGLLNEEPTASEAFRDRPIYFESYTPAFNFGWAPVRGVRVADAKYIDSPEPELYLLAEDSREGQRHNVHRRHPDVAAEMAHTLHDLLDTSLKTPPLSGDVEVADPEVLENLRALGYLATGTREEPQWNAEDDLKKRLPLYNTFLTATAEIGGGNTTGGAQLLLDILRADPQNPRALWQLAEVVVTNPGQIPEGLAVLEAAAQNPELSKAVRAAFLTNCGRSYLALADPQQALAYFTDARNLEPNDPIVLGWLSTASLYLGRLDEALGFARQAAEQAPGSDQFGVLLGALLFCSEHREEGRKVWDEMLTRSSTPCSPWYIAGLCARDATIAALLREPFSRAAAETPQELVRAALYAALGQVQFNVGQYEAALSSFQEVASLLETEDTWCLWWRARSLTSLGRSVQARQLLERAYQQNREQIQIVLDLAAVHLATGEAAKAAELLTEYYQSFPESPTAANNLAWILAETAQSEDDLDRALALAKFACKRWRGSAGFSDTLGWVHVKRKDPESAIFALSRAVSLQPDNAEYNYHLGLAYRLAGRLDQAREAFAAAVKLAPKPRPTWFEEARQSSVPEHR